MLPNIKSGSSARTRFSSVPILVIICAYLLLACVSNVLTCFGPEPPTWFHRFFPLAGVGG